jgi:hypothetical protein
MRITKTARLFAPNLLAVEVGRKRAELEERNAALSTRDRRWINKCVGMHTKTLSTSVLPDIVVLGIICLLLNYKRRRVSPASLPVS